MSIATDILFSLGEMPDMRMTTLELADDTGHGRKSICVIARRLHKQGIVSSTRTGRRSVTAHYWIEEAKLPTARAHFAKLKGETACRWCGCCDSWACEEGCHWVEPDFCSACLGATDGR